MNSAPFYWMTYHEGNPGNLANSSVREGEMHSLRLQQLNLLADQVGHRLRQN